MAGKRHYASGLISNAAGQPALCPKGVIEKELPGDYQNTGNYAPADLFTGVSQLMGEDYTHLNKTRKATKKA